MLRARVGKVDGVLITHEHNDHVAGMDDLRPYYFMQKAAIPVYASEFVQKELQSRFAYAFDSNPYPGAPRFELHTIAEDAIFTVNGLEVIPIQVAHGGGVVLGFRLGDFTYITDAKSISVGEREKIRGSKVLVLNALRTTPHYSHLALQESIDLARDCNVPQTWFTHISHEMGLHQDVQATLPPGFGLAYDGLRITTQM
jgi:phosphoribosyl 1,2-cyclic phosphate phosphodiesterase